MNRQQYLEFCRLLVAEQFGITPDRVSSRVIAGPRRQGLAPCSHPIDLYWESENQVARYVNIGRACWRKARPVVPAEVLLIQKVKEEVGAHLGVVLTNTRFTSAAVALAQAKGIVLLMVRPAFDPALLHGSEPHLMRAQLQQLAQAGKPLFVYEIVQQALGLYRPPSRRHPTWQLLSRASLTNVARVRELIVRGADVRHPCRRKKISVIHWFCTRHQRDAASNDVVAALLDAGADVNDQEVTGLYSLSWATPAMRAARAGNDVLLSLLCARGADLGRVDSTGRSVVHHLVSGWVDNHEPRGFAACLRILCAARVDLNLQDKNGRTPLMIAVKHGRRRALKALLGAGADVHIKNRRNRTAFDFLRNDHQGEFRRLLGGPPVDGPT